MSFISNFVERDLLSGLRVQPDQDLIGSGLLDSLMVMRLIQAIEEELSVEIDGDDIVPRNFRTIRTIEALVERKRSGD